MKLKHLASKMRGFFLPLIIGSTLLELLFLDGYFIRGTLLAVISAAAFSCYVVWFTTFSLSYAMKVSHRKSYYLTMGIIMFLLVVPAVVAAAFDFVPYYFFFYFPYAILYFAKLTSLLVATVVSVSILFIVYTIVLLTVKHNRKKNRHRHHHHSGDVVIDTTNFIMKD